MDDEIPSTDSPAGGTVDAEIKGSSIENPELWKDVPLIFKKVWMSPESVRI